ncbi:ABC-type branched-chain amino acid transport system, substrate-binding protein [Salinihabitans flavidus]|uniref:ABC-type branched-chain amino acid transport system, substrate-binding protein n=1 Tax=Salinihabitans flavidus TaxID=569882 RepID=A0A1H8LD04_9RHOB|nr:penicillin-binding protein activator [Salinihabitans flavidus]SEO03007.1 ABC-type branched-chain amino acid transport system, substrate-binding protein [Salinihabitans flavidus]
MFAAFKPARRFLKGAVLALAALGTAACAPGITTATGPSIDTSKPVPVALLVPSGSDRSGDAVLAQSLENAARLAISDLDGVDIDLRVYSTQGNAGVAQQAAVKAVNDGAQIILGPVFAEAANAAGNAVASRGINMLSFSNNTTIAGGNVFVLGPTFENTADRLVGYAARQGRDNIVVVHAENVSGQLGRNAIQSAISRNGAQLAGTVPYEFSQQGVIAAASEVRDMTRQTNANAVFLAADTSGALPLFSQMLPEAGISPETTQFIGLTRWDIPAQTLELPGVQGGWFALPDPERNQQFQSRYARSYGGLPHPIAGLAYDGIAAIGALVKSGKRDALSASALTQGAGFQGVNGVFRLRADGTNERGLAVATIRDKKVVVLDPAPRSFRGFGS